MIVYQVQVLKSAVRELSRLDKLIAKRVTARIQWLAGNLDQAKPIPLKGNLAGLYKLREGGYRIIYELLLKERLIVIHSIGHRREIYRRR